MKKTAEELGIESTPTMFCGPWSDKTGGVLMIPKGSHGVVPRGATLQVNGDRLHGLFHKPLKPIGEYLMITVSPERKVTIEDVTNADTSAAS